MDLDDILQQPCPCGSGRALGDCCAAGGIGPPGEMTRAITRALEQQLEGREFASTAGMQAFLDARVEDHNRRPLDDFEGLSPSQMQVLLARPFETSPLAGLDERLPAQPDVPVLALFDQIVQAAGSRGLKLTARGNLPLKLAKTADAWLQEHGARDAGIHSVTTELDVDELHVTRLVGGLAGLLRKSRGYLHITRKAEKLLGRGQQARLYGELLETYCRRFNWAYRDGFGDLGIIQHSFGFALYLLHRHGKTWRPATFYEDAFLRAFPMALEEPDDRGPYLEPDHRVRLAWTIRTLHGLGFLFGLVELAGEDGPAPILPDDGLRVRAAPLLADVFPHPPPG